MYVILRDGICISVNSLPLDEASFAKNEMQLEVSNVEEPLSLLGKKYVKGKFVEPKKDQDAKQADENLQRLQYLKETDWKVNRHRDQLDMGVPTSMTDEEFKELLRERQKAREAIIKLD